MSIVTFLNQIKNMNEESAENASILPPLKFNPLPPPQPRMSFQQSPRLASILAKQNAALSKSTISLNNAIHQPILPQNNKIPGLNSPRQGIVLYPRTNHMKKKRIILPPLDFNYQENNNKKSEILDAIMKRKVEEEKSSILVQKADSYPQENECC